MKNYITIGMVMALTLSASAQSRDAFLKQQAFAEMQRVSGQMDVLQNNLEELQRRVSRLEGGNQSNSLKAEVESLRSQVAELRRELQSQRGEIVRDLTGRIAKIQKETTPPPPPKALPPKPAYKGPCQEYVVQSGDTLSLVAQAFNTKVDTIKSMNNLRNNNLRVGQKLLVPKVKE